MRRHFRTGAFHPERPLYARKLEFSALQIYRHAYTVNMLHKYILNPHAIFRPFARFSLGGVRVCVR